MKVYGGFKFLTNDIHEIDSFMNKLREEYGQKAKEKASKFFGDTITHYIDFMTLNPDKVEDDGSPWMTAFNEFQNRQIEVKQKQVREPAVDFSFNVLVIPHDGDFYGIVYTQQTDMLKDFLSHDDIVVDYHYQNQTDQPEGVSDEEWNQRDKIWNDIFNKNPIPSLVGFSYEIVLEDFHDYPMVEELLNYIPDFDTRVAEQAKNMLYSEFMKNRKPTQENIGKLLRHFKEYFESDKGKKRFNEFKEEASNKLKKVISIEDMKKFKA